MANAKQSAKRRLTMAERAQQLMLVHFPVCVRPSHLPSPAKPRHGVHLNLSGHQF